MYRVIYVLAILSTLLPLHAQRADELGFLLRQGHFESSNSRRAEVTMLEQRLEPFYHGVASGDPTSSAVIIWTRVTPRNADTAIDVRWAVALDTAFDQIVVQGTTQALASRDYTVKIDATGLQSNTVFYYAFQAYNKVSLIGRTRTFPAVGGDHARIAVVSCSNYPAGYFNAYQAIGKRNDLDAVIHLGDYIYEYSADSTSYAGATGKQLNRLHLPFNEIISLADYRARYSQYRLDPDLRSMHQQHPVVHVWDDHESANDSYEDGAENHQATEGDWQTRKRISKQVCFEWMPTREGVNGQLYRRLDYGDLADIFMLDTRLDGRDKQIEDLGDDASPASKQALNDPKRKLVSERQFDWLANSLVDSKSHWHVLGNQVLFTQYDVTPIDTAYLFKAVGPIYKAFLQPQVPTLQNLIESAFYGDVWSNYPAQRAALDDRLRAGNIKNLIITTGDFHCSFASDVERTWRSDTSSMAVEFVTPSVSSPNFDENLNSQAILRPILPALLSTIDTTLYGQNPHLHWADLVDHGYLILDITKDVAQADWFMVEDLLTRSSKESWIRGYRVFNGISRAVSTTVPSMGKAKKDTPAPPEPPSVVLRVDEDERSQNNFTILSFGPLPADHALTLTVHAAMQQKADIVILSSSAQVVMRQTLDVLPGLSTISVNVEPFAQGSYLLALVSNGQTINIPIVVKK